MNQKSFLYLLSRLIGFPGYTLTVDLWAAQVSPEPFFPQKITLEFDSSARCRRSTFTDAQSPRSRVTLARPRRPAQKTNKRAGERTCCVDLMRKRKHWSTMWQEVRYRSGEQAAHFLANPSPDCYRKQHGGMTRERTCARRAICCYVLFMFGPIQIHFHGAIFLDLSENTLCTKTLKTKLFFFFF